MLNAKTEKALNVQVNQELHSAYLYLSMAANLESRNLKGFAHWLVAQWNEEIDHAMRLYRYILDRGGQVRLTTIEGPATEWKSPLVVFKEVLQHEKDVTKLIYELVDLAAKEGDHATVTMLQPFVSEQVEEEANANKIVQTLKMINDSPQGLLMLDRELAGRK